MRILMYLYQLLTFSSVYNLFSMVRWNIHDDNLAKRYHELASNHVRVCLTWLIMDVS